MIDILTFIENFYNLQVKKFHWESILFFLLYWNHFLFKFYSFFLFILNGIFFYFKGSFLALLIFLSIAGNILVCIAIYTERSLRRIGNLFLASLAIADLFVASLVMTFAGVNDILGKKIYLFIKNLFSLIEYFMNFYGMESKIIMILIFLSFWLYLINTYIWLNGEKYEEIWL